MQEVRQRVAPGSGGGFVTPGLGRAKGTSSRRPFLERRVIIRSSYTVLSGESQMDSSGHSAQRGLRASQIFLPNQMTW